MRDEVLVVEASGVGERVDRYLVLQGEPFHSRSQVQSLIGEGLVSINGQPCLRASTRLVLGDTIKISLPPPQGDRPLPQHLPLNIVYEDDHILVINKDRGMVVHPAPGHSEGTLVNAILAHCGGLAGVGDAQRPGIVHRLDKETSGLMIVAKSSLAYAKLVEQLKERSVDRHYVAFVHGVAQDERWTVDAPIGRDPLSRQRMAVVATGKPATTHFVVRERYRRFTCIEAELVTGRTHQIRVHLSHVGHPVVGDVRYGALANIFELGQALHAHRLEFSHPLTGEVMLYEVPLPPELKVLRARLKEA